MKTPIYPHFLCIMCGKVYRVSCRKEFLPYIKTVSFFPQWEKGGNVNNRLAQIIDFMLDLAGFSAIIENDVFLT